MTAQRGVQIIGVDCSVDPRRIGLACGIWSEGAIRGIEVLSPRGDEELRGWVVGRLREASATLLAMDSPLGWPAPLGAALARHAAGMPLRVEPDRMFRRLTDRVVRDRIGKQPLEVGADRIARTALAALRLLDEVGSSIGTRIDLAWEPARIAKAAAIETYPAAWLLSQELPARSYKDQGAEAGARRRLIIARAEELLAGGLPPQAAASLRSNAHLLDAVICVLCGAEFLRGGCPGPGPDQRELARKEGWIWFPAGGE